MLGLNGGGWVITKEKRLKGDVNVVLIILGVMMIVAYSFMMIYVV